MGCDGGITWYQAWNEKDCETASRLIEPTGLLDDELRDEDWKFLKKNKHTLPKHIIIARYGTDLEHNGLIDLAEILRHPSACGDLERTFEDIALEIATCPDWKIYNLAKLDQLIFRKIAGYSSLLYKEPFGCDIEKRSRIRLEQCEKHMQRALANVQRMTVSEWCNTLYSTIRNWDQPGIVETWT